MLKLWGYLDEKIVGFSISSRMQKTFLDMIEMWGYLEDVLIPVPVRGKRDPKQIEVFWMDIDDG